MLYSVEGIGGAIATAAALEALAALWNPSATRRIKVLECGLFLGDFNSQLGNSLVVVRITARGTPGATVTPDADNAEDGASAPPSGALLDLNEYSVQPTLATPELCTLSMLPVGSGVLQAGSGFYAPICDWIPPGTGIAIVETKNEAYGGAQSIHANFTFED